MAIQFWKALIAGKLDGASTDPAVGGGHARVELTGLARTDHNASDSQVAEQNLTIALTSAR